MDGNYIDPPSSFNLLSQSELSKIRKKQILGGQRSHSEMSGISVKPKAKRIKTFYTLMARGGFIADLGEKEQKKEPRPWHINKVKRSNIDSDSSDD